MNRRRRTPNSPVTSSLPDSASPAGCSPARWRRQASPTSSSNSNAETVPRRPAASTRTSTTGDVTSREALEHARIAHARALVLLINDPPAARSAISAAREENPDIPILVRTRYLAEREQLLALGATQVICEELESGVEMSANVLQVLGLDAPAIRQQVGAALTDADRLGLSRGSGEWIEALGDRSR